MSNTTLLVGTEPLTRAASTIHEAAERMAQAAAQIEDTMYRRRQWEEEYLQRLEALVERELTFYGDGK